MCREKPSRVRATNHEPAGRLVRKRALVQASTSEIDNARQKQHLRSNSIDEGLARKNLPLP